MKKMTYLIIGHLCLILGIIGAFIPVLPTTPFLLLAAFLYSQSSPKLHNWIISHKYLGPPVKDWQDRGVIGLKAKIIATVMIILVIGLRFPSLAVNMWIKVSATIILMAVLIFIWTRPSKIKSHKP